MSTNFGKTWWGQQFLNSLSNIDYSNRLPRGSSYAKKGAVTKIEISENIIHAKVSGSRPTPYKVDIILPPFFDPELIQFIKALSKKPTIISKLLNRELDPEVLNIAEQTGLKVFPKQWTDFKMQCSCPDWAVPCKHLAAVIYKISAEIDNNPFLVFELHRVKLIDELAKIGITVNTGMAEIPTLIELYFDNTKKENKPYIEDNAYQKLSFSTLSPIHEPLTSLLSNFPVFYQGKGDFKDIYISAINRIVKNAQKVILGKISLENLFIKAKRSNQHINHHAKEQVILNEVDATKVVVNGTDFSFVDFLSQLAQIDTAKTLDYQPSTAALHSFFYLALHMIANGAIVPQIVALPNKHFKIRWLPATLSKEVSILVSKLDSMLPDNVFLWVQKNKYKSIN